MNLKSLAGLWYAVLLLGFAQCSRIEVEQPTGGDTTRIVIPAIRLELDSTGKGSFSIQSLIETYPEFSIRFDPMAHGRFVVDLSRQQVRFEKTDDDWLIDSTRYEVCVKGKCDSGKLVVRNFKPATPSACDTLPVIGPIRVALLGQATISVVARASFGKIVELRPGAYNVSILSTDSTKLFYRAVGNSQFLGYDEIGYSVRDSLGKCHRGIVQVVIGDECDVEATDDVLTVNSSFAQWPVSQFLANEASPCSIPLDGFQFRLSTSSLDYNYLKVNSPNGNFTDTLIAGTQFLRYRKTNTAATADSIWYYLYDRDNSLRISRAKIKLRF